MFMVKWPPYHIGLGTILKCILKLNNFEIKEKTNTMIAIMIFRGSESATLLQPRQKDLALLGLGYSVGTPKEGITANAIVVNSFADLKKRAKEVNFI